MYKQAEPLRGIVQLDPSAALGVTWGEVLLGIDKGVGFARSDEGAGCARSDEESNRECSVLGLVGQGFIYIAV